MRRRLGWLSLLVVGAVLAVAGYLALSLDTGADTSPKASDRTTPSTRGPASTSPPGRGSPEETATPSISSGTPADDSGQDVPARLVIPALRVNAPVEGIGMSTDPDDPKYRTLVPPNDPAVVGWWQGGMKPGASEGSALFLGHTKKIPGVVGVGDGAFGHLSRLGTGDRINVFTSSGLARYEVTEIVPKKDFDDVAREAQNIDDRDFPGGRLVLITCWYDGDEFTGNTFVFAQPV